MIVLIFTIIALVGFCVLFFKGVKAGRYDQDIAFLEDFINTSDVNKANFKYINKRFVELDNIDKKRTQKLFTDFCFKYKSIWHEVVGNEDFIANSKKIAG